MKISILIGIFVIFAIVEFSEAGYSKSCPIPYKQNPHPEGICGFTLVRFSKAVCETFKRGGKGLNKNKALGYVRSRRSIQTWQPHNIICECCYNKCSVSEMLEYC